ncbi:unnamed protein product [Ceutorhynchus assimilis]|uniref:Uncharacterized protein n=1 Tax=Ceutorhynchus assimilis TaxID=467358 RepID=A0A9N9MCP6_9CUCU|nr:unnamed protein product [Ceutorhynchus assimilis]
MDDNSDEPQFLLNPVERVPDNSGQSQLLLNPVERVPFTWTVPDFARPRLLQVWENFVVKHGCTKWLLVLYPKGVDETSEDYVSLYLGLLNNSKKTKVTADFEFRLMNVDNKTERTMKFRRPKTFVKGQKRGFVRFFRRFDLFNRSQELLPNGELTIAGQIIIYLDPEPNIPDQAEPLLESEMAKYYTNLFENQKLTDTTFLIGDRAVKAHKAILALRSEVFRAMFECDMLEKFTSTVLIVDIEYDVFKAMLRFIYTDEPPKSDMAKELLMPADKYDLMHLKSICEAEMSRNMTIEHSAEVLYLADLHRCDILKHHAIDFIVTFAQDVTNTEGWRALERIQPRLFAEANEEIRTRIIV